MAIKNHADNISKRRRLFTVIGLALILLGGTGWILTRGTGTVFALNATGTVEPYDTTAARIGEIALTISGTGTLVTGTTVDLAFPVSGVVSGLSVSSGDLVSSGQVLAHLEDTTQLDLEVKNRRLAAMAARQALDELLAGADVALAQAAVDLANAQIAHEEAADDLLTTGQPRCAQAKTEEYYYQWLNLQRQVNEWEGYLDDPDTGYGHDYILEKLTPLQKQRDLAYGNWKYCETYTQDEIEDSQANLASTTAALKLAQENFDRLSASEGVDPLELQKAQLTLQKAQLQLQSAEEQLAGAELVSPMDGMVMEVNASEGDEVDTGVILSIASVEQPQVEVNMDETDMLNFSAGCPAQVTFDSLPDQVFTGMVTQVTPMLVSVNNVSMVEGLVTLDEVNQATPVELLPGLTASVEIICQQASDALIIPTQALHQTAGASPYVYVLVNDQPEKREVQIGIKTVAIAQVLSGLEAGEAVITSTVEE